MAPRRSAAVACASAAVLGSGALCGSAFVPSSQGLSRPQPFAAQEGAELRSVEIGETTYFSASSMAGSAALASAAAVVAIAGKKVSTRTYKSLVALQFSGGDVAPAPKAFDPATELGVQDPVGFWDPLGFCEDKDEATFKFL